MKKRYLMAAIALAGAVYHQSRSAPLSPIESPTASAVPAREAVRQMAEYLETASPETVAALSGRSVESAAPVAERVPASATGATDSSLSRIEEQERRIAARYPDTESGARIRRYVALSLSDVDTDFQPELSRVRLLNDLARAAPSAAAEIQGALQAMGEEDASAESERAALVTLASHLGTHEAALPAVEQLLQGEISRRTSLDPDANEQRLNQLLDSYTGLISDPRRQADFVRAGIEAQDEPRTRQALEAYLEMLVRRVDTAQVP